MSTVMSGPLVSYKQASSAHQDWMEELDMLRLTLILLRLLPWHLVGQDMLDAALQ